MPTLDFMLVEQEAPGKDLKIEQIKDMSKQAAFAALRSRPVRYASSTLPDRMTGGGRQQPFKAAGRTAAELDVHYDSFAVGTAFADDPFASHPAAFRPDPFGADAGRFNKAGTGAG